MYERMRAANDAQVLEGVPVSFIQMYKVIGLFTWESSVENEKDSPEWEIVFSWLLSFESSEPVMTLMGFA